MNYLNEFSQPYTLDTISKIIINTQHNDKKIRREWNKIMNFLHSFPDANLIDDLSSGFHIRNDIREDLIIDSHQKVYRQIRDNIDFSDKKQTIVQITYYVYDQDIKKSWKRDNIKLGEVDMKGQLNTGSSLILYTAKLDWRVFMVAYSKLLN